MNYIARFIPGMTAEKIDQEIDQRIYDEYAYSRLIDRPRMADLEFTRKLLTGEKEPWDRSMDGYQITRVILDNYDGRPHAFWFARKDENSEVFTISYEQAIGREFIGEPTMAKLLGKLLL